MDRLLLNFKKDQQLKVFLNCGGLENGLFALRNIFLRSSVNAMVKR